MIHPIPDPFLRRALPAFLALLLAAPAAAEPVVGRVVAVRGEAVAVDAEGRRRPLTCDDPVHAGERVETAKEGALGLLSEGVYTGLAGDGVMRVARTDRGAPQLDLERGHLRVLDAERDAGARLVTPGLVAFDAGTDTEALVFAEKAWTVSMVCPYEGSLAVTSPRRGHAGTQAPAGQCAVDKPNEDLYLVDASHPRVPVLADDCGTLTPVAARMSDHFQSPADVALGPDVAAAGPSLAPSAAAPRAGLARNVCDAGGACTPALPAPPFNQGSFPPVGPP